MTSCAGASRRSRRRARRRGSTSPPIAFPSAPPPTTSWAASSRTSWDALVGARTPPAAAPELHRVRSIVTVGLLIARAALRREESRGGHFRTDFPNRDDIHWRKHVSDVLARA